LKRSGDHVERIGDRAILVHGFSVRTQLCQMAFAEGFAERARGFAS
jgi:hypothetical protein